MPAGLFFVGMSSVFHTSSRFSQVGTILTIVISTLLLDGLLVAWLWGTGVDFAIMDRVMPGESGFLINPLPDIYQGLLGAVFVANTGLLVYLLLKRKRLYVLSFAIGAAVPMGYLISILASA